MLTGISINIVYDVIANDNKLKKDIKKLCKNHHAWEDLYQDTLLYVFSLDKNKLHEILLNGNLAGYVAQIVMNQFNSKTSEFYRKYRKQELTGVPLFTPQSDTEFMNCENIITEKLSEEINLDELFFDKKVNKLIYDDYNNYNQLIINKDKFEIRLKEISTPKQFQIYNLHKNYQIKLKDIAKNINCSEQKILLIYKKIKEIVAQDGVLQQIIKDSKKYVN